MDHSHVGGGMPSSYVPRKRKTVQPQQKSGVPCPVVQRMPERACQLSVIGLGPPKNDESHAQDALKMKRTYSRKSRYEDLQSVPIGGAEYPTTRQSSCSMMSSSGLSNGADPGSLAPPSARLPPRLLPKDCWPPGADGGRERGPPQDQPWNPSRDGRGPDQSWATGRDRPQDQAWNSGRDRGHPGPDHAWIPGRDRSHIGPDQAWTTSRDRGPDQAWATGRDRGQDQAWNPGRDQGRDRAPSGPEQAWNTGRGQDQAWNSTSRDRGEEQHVWRPDFQMKKVQRGEMDRTAPVISFPQNQEVRDSGSIPLSVGLVQSSSIPPSSASEQSLEEQKPKIFSTKKEPPVYPAGSQEERWQLQILAKGRVTCPKCKSVSRKTVEGLKKHMENCRLHPFTCQHCGKQLKSSTGMKYHIMADHSNLPSPEDANGLDDHTMKDKLRKILKRLGKLKCSKEGCTGSFTSIMGYMYHMKKCGKEESELEKMVLNCSHCGKAYKSKAGLEYHLKSEHAPQAPQPSEEEEAIKAERETNPERTASGRIKRMSAQVADFHLAEIANDELSKEWPKRKVLKDLVPDDKKLKYARPGLPAFSQEVLRKWKNEVKLQRKVQCPNQGCDCVYTSVSGLKAHLGLCTRGDFEAGKYRCLICNKEFNSESGVKYHINSVHSQDWFVTNKKACAKFEKFLKNKPKEFVHSVDQQIIDQYHQHHLHHQQNLHHQHHHHHHHHHQHQLHPHHQPHLHHDPPHHHHHHQQQQQQAQHLHLQPHPAQQQQPPPPLLDQQLLLPQLPPPHPEQHQPALHYTPLEPWVDVARRVIQGGPTAAGEMVPMDKPAAGDGPIGSGPADGIGGKRKEKAGRGKGNGNVKRKGAFAAFGGTSSSSGTSSSESEVEEHVEGQRQFDQWSLKRPGIMEANSEVAKRTRNNT